jgi:hypothetical protein
MSSTGRPVEAILAERMAVVTQVSALNSRQLRNSQLVGGAEVDVLACRRALAEAEERERQLRVEIARDAAEHAVLEERLSTLDRELAAH